MYVVTEFGFTDRTLKLLDRLRLIEEGDDPVACMLNDPERDLGYTSPRV